MKLSAELYAELAASFGIAGIGERPERRKAARLQLHVDAWISMVDDNGRRLVPSLVPVRDFSPRGIAILHPRPLSPGSQFVIDLPRKSGGTVAVLCTVAHVRPSDEAGLYNVGAELTCVLRPSDRPATVDDVRRVEHSVLG